MSAPWANNPDPLDPRFDSSNTGNANVAGQTTTHSLPNMGPSLFDDLTGFLVEQSQRVPVPAAFHPQFFVDPRGLGHAYAPAAATAAYANANLSLNASQEDTPSAPSLAEMWAEIQAQRRMYLAVMDDLKAVQQVLKSLQENLKSSASSTEDPSLDPTVQKFQ